MSNLVQTGWLVAALGLLTGCVAVREPGLREMRVTKDGTEILLEQPYAKVKAALEVVARSNIPAGLVHKGVWEPATGRECQLVFYEDWPSTISSHFTQIEARWIAEGLTQLRVKSEARRMSLLLALFGQNRWMSTRKSAVEQKRLQEVIEATSFKSGLIAPTNEYPPHPAHPL